MSDFGEAAKNFALQLTSFFLDYIPPNYSVRLNRELEKVADVMGIDLNTLKTCYRRLPPLPQLPLRGPPLRLPLPSPCHHRLHCGDERFMFSFITGRYGWSLTMFSFPRRRCWRWRMRRRWRRRRWWRPKSISPTPFVQDSRSNVICPFSVISSYMCFQ